MAKRNSTVDVTSSTHEQEPNEIRPVRQQSRVEPPRHPSRAKRDTDTDAPREGVLATLEKRFVRVGKVFYFPDGATAFQDHGRRLSTPSENTEVVASLLAIARERDWRHLVVTGTERFRREAWRQGVGLGLEVRGYAPTTIEQARAVRPPPSPPISEATASAAAAVDAELAARARPAEPPVPESIEGRWLAGGTARYQHRPDGTPSYFVRLATAEGERTVWGRDLHRALAQAVSKPEIGQQIVLRNVGRDQVTIRRPTQQPDGTTSEREETRFRNRWWVESSAWLAERAALAGALRDPSRAAPPFDEDFSRARLAVRQAEVMAEQQIGNEAQRHRFVGAVREQLAQRLGRGEAMPAPVLRVRRADRPPPERDELTR